MAVRGHHQAASGTAPWFRRLLFGILLLACAYVVVAVGVSGYSTVTDRPELALNVWRSGAAAEEGAVDRLGDGDAAGAEQLARESLNRSLLSAEATRVLGFALFRQQGDGSAVMDRAAELGWRDTPTQLWAIRAALEADDPVTMMQRIDAMLRREVYPRDMLALVAHLLPSRAFRDALRDRLAADPPWRESLFDMLGGGGAEEGSVASLFAEQAASGQPFPIADLARSVNMMIAHEDYAPAYRLWTARVRLGGFDVMRPTGDAGTGDRLPFAWTLAATGQTTATIGPDSSTGGHDALHVQADVQPQATVASRLLVLAPGRHVIRMRMAGESAGLHWVLLCAPKRSFLASLPSSASTATIGTDFVIPLTKCSAQLLTLQPMDRHEGKPDVRYSDLAIDPS